MKNTCFSVEGPYEGLKNDNNTSRAPTIDTREVANMIQTQCFIRAQCMIKDKCVPTVSPSCGVADNPI